MSNFTADSSTLTYIGPIQGQYNTVFLAEAKISKEIAIIRSLNFENRPVRFTSISEAHNHTFSWALSDRPYESATSTRGNLLKWLTKGSGFFWVSGKPGSGKSTLMKFIANQPAISDALSRWAKPKPAILCFHFFWKAGTPMQKSLNGLLRTLLYDIFRQLPELIESCCPHRWDALEHPLGANVWDKSELLQALRSVIDHKVLPAKFCFFIDGLDEYEGDHVDFCLALKDLNRSEDVKICVSSRPWNVFEDSFGDDPSSKLYIHELTRHDIRLFSKCRLKEHPRWRQIARQNREELINKITDRAAGVFLWVCLVTQELRHSLTEYDNFSEMQNRLDRIPDDLEAFFKQILESIDSFYHQKMATSLLITLTAKQPAPVAVYSFHDMEYSDVNYALDLQVLSKHPNTIKTRNKEMIKRLNARCRGLIEVNSVTDTIQFLHRTVMDFLKTDEMTTYLQQKVPTGFAAELSLLRAYVALIKTTQFSGPLAPILEETLGYALDLQETSAANKLLKELQLCLDILDSRGIFCQLVRYAREPRVYLLASLEKVKDERAGIIGKELFHYIVSVHSYLSKISPSAESDDDNDGG
jgi:NACHT domain